MHLDLETGGSWLCLLSCSKMADVRLSDEAGFDVS